jgi:hypothetical protein
VGAWCDSRLGDKVSVGNREKLRSFDPSQIPDIIKIVVSAIPANKWQTEGLGSPRRYFLVASPTPREHCEGKELVFMRW